jgi:hypothetical protein
MSVKLWESVLVENWRTKLSDSISASADYFGLISTASLNPDHLIAPGVLVIDRVDTTTTEAPTPSKREYISFTSKPSGCTIYGVTRGIGGSNAQGHSGNSWVDAISSTTHWNDLVDFLGVEHLSDGTHDVFSHIRQITVTGISGASGIRGDFILVPGANISIHSVSGASGYAYIGIDAATQQTFVSGNLPPIGYTGPLSVASIVGGPLLVGYNATIKSISAILLSPASGSSLILDINKNFTTIFTDQNTRLTITGGGTYASTASVAVTSLLSGDLLTMDVDTISSGNTISCLIET